MTFDDPSVNPLNDLDLEGTSLDDIDPGWGAAPPEVVDPERRIIDAPFYAPTPMLWPRSLNEDRVKALEFTVWFVEWLLAVWRLEKRLVPPCWVQHPDLVHELWALGMSYYDSHTMPNPGGPAQWLLYLDYQRRRLAENKGAQGCATRGSHELIGNTDRDTAQRLATYGVGDAGSPELPVAIGPWTWPHHHPDPAMAPDQPTDTARTEGAS